MNNPIELVQAIFCRNMKTRYSENEIQVGCRIWNSFACNSDNLGTSKMEGWAAAIDLILNRLAIKFQPQKDICELYRISATTLHSRFNFIQDDLKIIFYDERYPLKQLWSQLEESSMMRIRHTKISISDKRYSFIKSAEMAQETLLLDCIGDTMRKNLQKTEKLPLQSNNRLAQYQLLLEEIPPALIPVFSSLQFIFEEESNTAFRVHFLTCLTLIAILEGINSPKILDILSLIRKAEEDLMTPNESMFWSKILMFLTEAYIRLGALDQAKSIFEKLSTYPNLDMSCKINLLNKKAFLLSNIDPSESYRIFVEILNQFTPKTVRQNHLALKTTCSTILDVINYHDRPEFMPLFEKALTELLKISEGEVKKEIEEILIKTLFKYKNIKSGNDLMELGLNLLSNLTPHFLSDFPHYYIELFTYRSNQIDDISHYLFPDLTQAQIFQLTNTILLQQVSQFHFELLHNKEDATQTFHEIKDWLETEFYSIEETKLGANPALSEPFDALLILIQLAYKFELKEITNDLITIIEKFPSESEKIELIIELLYNCADHLGIKGINKLLPTALSRQIKSGLVQNESNLNDLFFLTEFFGNLLAQLRDQAIVTEFRSLWKPLAPTFIMRSFGIRNLLEILLIKWRNSSDKLIHTVNADFI